MIVLSQTQRRAQGQAAEDRFRAWLDRCRLPQIYIEQSMFTFPDLCGAPHKSGYVAQTHMWRRTHFAAVLMELDASCATY